MSTKFLLDNYCFVCGKENENGLRLEIVETENGVKSKVVLPKWTQGYNRIVHGGIVCAILDEMVAWAAKSKGHKSATVDLKVRLKKAMFVEREYLATGQISSVKNRLVLARSEIRDKKDTLIAQAEAKLLKVSEENE
ncbi:hypothetical protein BXT86_02035 [candidate division WOR-3 bacterium 4484_100]|uniref:Acyl-coenzyme A thioesterase THEM4 n=1 Tax=candidate division WOR-3 bacterium 4484_100 TaxID=1936077 RepID=A0A1V4QHA8_UNCW3|nr:MAG: hypothetical protein BXT86_02035 [candidate division WOR-3 bacterium 4484_100]